MALVAVVAELALIAVVAELALVDAVAEMALVAVVSEMALVLQFGVLRGKMANSPTCPSQLAPAPHFVLYQHESI